MSRAGTRVDGMNLPPLDELSRGMSLLDMDCSLVRFFDGAETCFSDEYLYLRFIDNVDYLNEKGSWPLVEYMAVWVEGKGVVKRVPRKVRWLRCTFEAVKTEPQYPGMNPDRFGPYWVARGPEEDGLDSKLVVHVDQLWLLRFQWPSAFLTETRVEECAELPSGDSKGKLNDVIPGLVN